MSISTIQGLLVGTGFPISPFFMHDPRLEKAEQNEDDYLHECSPVVEWRANDAFVAVDPHNGGRNPVWWASLTTVSPILSYTLHKLSYAQAILTRRSNYSAK